MIDFDQFERRLAVALRSDADVSVAPFDPASIARAAIQIDRTRQRRVVRMPRRIATMNTSARFAAAAVIAVLAIGGAFYLLRPGQSTVGTPSPTPGASSSPSQPASPSAVPSPTVVSATAPSWTATGSMIKPRSDHTATLLPNGKVLVAGGQDGDSRHSVASAELYDPRSGTWTATGSMGTPRSDHTATMLLDGKVLVTGGVTSLHVVDGINTTAELYDPVTGAWTAAGTMATPRYGHAAALLPKGKVLVAGGADSGEPHVSSLLDSAELYDPVTGAWSTTGTMVTLYNNEAAAPLADGRLLVGGFPPELYDPTAASWTAIGSKVLSGWYGPAVLLTDGRVFVLGAGVPGQDVSTETAAAVFDPVTGSWTAAGQLDRRRTNFTYTATLLPDGEVLVVGGSEANAETNTEVSMASAELYDPGTGK